jgi:hypothetical protein
VRQKRQVFQKIKYVLDPALGHSKQAFLIIRFAHHCKVAIGLASDGCRSWLVVIQRQFSETNTLFERNNLKHEFLL